MSINLKDNNLNGIITEQSLSVFEYLELLDLSHNPDLSFSDLSLTLTPLANTLQYLSLESNDITSEEFPLTNTFPFLRTLLLNSNKFEFNVDVEIQFIPNIEVLWLGDNMVSGDIELIVGGLNEGLQQLQLNDNNLSGTIPASIFTFPGLLYINLSRNRLEGGVDLGEGGSGVTHFWGDGCGLSGEVGGRVEGFQDLKVFSVEVRRVLGVGVGGWTTCSLMMYSRQKVLI